MTPILCLLLGLLVGFVLGALFGTWAKPTEPEARPYEPPVFLDPVSAPRGSGGMAVTVVDELLPTAHAIALQLYVAGVQDGCGEKVPASAVRAHELRGAKPLRRISRNIALLAGRSYARGVLELRAALSRYSGLDDILLDQAVSVALARSTAEDERSKGARTHGHDAHTDPSA